MPRTPRDPRQLAEGRAVARSLRAARELSAVPQSGIASGSGVSLDTVRKLELEQILSPSFLTVARIARVLDLTLDQLAADAIRAGERVRPS